MRDESLQLAVAMLETELERLPYHEELLSRANNRMFEYPRHIRADLQADVDHSREIIRAARGSIAQHIALGG